MSVTQFTPDEKAERLSERGFVLEVLRALSHLLSMLSASRRHHPYNKFNTGLCHGPLAKLRPKKGSAGPSSVGVRQRCAGGQRTDGGRKGCGRMYRMKPHRPDAEGGGGEGSRDLRS